MKQIRVLLIEDHFLARMALHSALGGHVQMSIVGEARMASKVSRQTVNCCQMWLCLTCACHM